MSRITYRRPLAVVVGGLVLGVAAAGCDDSSSTRTVQVPAPEAEFVRQFGTSGASNDLANAVHVDAAGNIYIAGQTFGALPGETNAGNADAFVRKYDAAGNEVWTHEFGTAANDNAVAVFVDGAGVYTAGTVEAALPGQTFLGGASDAFVRRLDAATGDEVWTRQFGTAALDAIRALSVAPSGVYVAGQTNATLTSADGAVQTSGGAGDAFVRKYDTNGTETWTRQFGVPASNSTDNAQGISVDPTGVYIAGSTQGALGGQTFNGGANDAFLQQFNTDGVAGFTRVFGGSANANDNAAACFADGGAIYVSGFTTGQLGAAAFGNQDAFVRRFDATGAVAWTAQFGTSALDNAGGVSADTTGVYAAGRTDAALGGQTYAGGADAHVTKLDASTGAVVLTRQLGSPFLDFASAVAASPAGVHVAGQAQGNLPGQSDPSLGNIDVLLWKLDASGTTTYTRQFGTIGAVDDIGTSVAGDADGNIYVAGTTRGSLDPAFPGTSLDGFVRKYDRNGSIVWTRQLGTIGFDSLPALALSGSSLYVAGQTDLGFPNLTFAGPPTDIFLRKYDTDGNEIWTRQFGSPALDGPSSLVADASGVYIGGVTQGQLAAPVSGPSDAILVKYDAAGNPVFTLQFGSTSIDNVLAVTLDATGVYVAGVTQGNIAAAPQGQDAFVRKFSLDGTTVVWTQQYGVAGADTANAIVVGALGLFVGGSTSGNLTGTTPVSGPTDAYVRRLDPSTGAAMFTRQYGSNLSDSCLGVALDATGVIATGAVGSTLPGQVNVGLFDGYIQKLDGNGNVVFIRQFGTAQNDSPNAIFADGAGNVYIAGQANDAFPGLTSAGGADVFLVKLLPSRFP